MAMALAAAVVLPFLVADYMVFRFTLAVIWSIAVLGMVVLGGVSGQLSIGHAAFYGLGAYTAALLANRTGVSLYWALPLAALLCWAAGYAFGRVAGRQSLWNQALITYALVIVFPQTLRSRLVEGLTGGTQGLYLDAPAAPAWIGLGTDRWWYLLSLAVLVCGMWAVRNLVDSRSGRALRAVRDHDTAAAVQGVDVDHHRANAFGLSAAFVGVAGCLAAIQFAYVAPNTYSFWLSVQFLMGMVVGGMHSIYGAVIGGLFLQFMPDLAAVVGRGQSHILLAALLVATIVLMPDGLAGLAARAAGALRRWRAR
ncbi:MAG: branched-chain amino acid ABC transporter permease [Rhodospirillales bacterium]|nr:MAG: branched-chain amino acid ABC transporter permease [Rhodospirillales bacterium]